MRPSILCVALAGSLGCSLVRAPIREGLTDAPITLMDAPGEIDVPVMMADVPGLDAPTPDAPPDLMDVPAPPDAPAPLDVPRPPDVPMLDAPTCVPGCMGTVANFCTSTRDCALAGERCRVVGGVPECVCSDSPPTCAADGRAITSCAAGVATVTYCDELGCSDGACVSSCSAPAIGVGSTRINLCPEGADSTNRNLGGCTVAADGVDFIYRLDVPVRSRVTVTERDADGTYAVDTVVYLRGVCSDRNTQLACDDDVPCAEAADMTGCVGGEQWRESRFTVDLERGSYWLFADSIGDNMDGGMTWRCGVVEIVVDMAPL